MGARIPSGRFLLRIPPALHRELRDRAAGCGSSLNEFCRAAVETAVHGPTADVTTSSGTAAAEAVLAGFGFQVEAVVLFGSGARGHAGTWSDVDLLIVVAAAVPITRALYRTWDRSVAAAAAIRALGPSVSPHFAHLPVAAAGTRGGGGSLWLEVALHGIVLWQRGWALSRWLGSARVRMAEGAIRRRYAHGQPYWSYHGPNAQS